MMLETEFYEFGMLKHCIVRNKMGFLLFSIKGKTVGAMTFFPLIAFAERCSPFSLFGVPTRG